MPPHLFYCCYLIRSLHPDHKNKVYIGSTPDPIKRLRQHNGDLSQGAYKTCKRRPWEMVLFVHGFPTKQSALMFEWAWQHPMQSRHTKRQLVYGRQESTIGIRSSAQANLYLTKLRALYDLLCTLPFKRWPLKIRFMDPGDQALFLAEASSPDPTLSLSSHLCLSSGPSIDLLPLIRPSKERKESDWILGLPPSFPCHFCKETIDKKDLDRFVCCPGNYSNTCGLIAHLPCLADLFLAAEPLALIPIAHDCPVCSRGLVWGDLIYDLRLRIHST